MISIDVTVDLNVRIDEDAEPIDEQLGAVMEELVKLADSDCGISDPAVSYDSDLRLVTIEVVAESDDFDDAVVTADSCIRSAIHAAGGATPGWTVERLSQKAELADA
ncbi:hypothetical protein [Nocardioides sp.]|uniref:hypothetical protein n=1 Tax=Nocardioides sp. TaxID=35761 RepID=UPI00260554B6|nr:hypothetical protein [Nocardioides sp.]MCW2736111.1 hypothetical protein [Nocardioides sp.]